MDPKYSKLFRSFHDLSQIVRGKAHVLAVTHSKKEKGGADEGLFQSFTLSSRAIATLISVVLTAIHYIMSGSIASF
jgi:hypothetical protein